jgi:ribosomal protein S18 acetylase RimI-like enzyme
MKLGLVVPDSNTDYDIQLKKTRCVLPKETLCISTNDLRWEVVERLAVDVIIASELSKDWCYLLRGLGIVTIVFGQRELYHDLVDIVVDYKNIEGNHYFTGSRFDFHKEQPDLFLEMAELIIKLDWDTQYFGFNVAFISCFHLSENIYKAVARYMVDNEIRLVEYLCNCHDRRSVLIAEKEGFSFADIRLTLIKKLENIAPIAPNANGVVFRKAVEEDIGELEIMAGRIYKHSRYFFDDNFDTDKVVGFYESWIKKAVRGEYDDECWCLKKEGRLAAFCSVKYNDDKSARIGLVGVHDAFVGRGLGKQIVERVIEMLAEKGIIELSVVTQGRNYQAQNLYGSVGFKTKETQLWYHKWR